MLAAHRTSCCRTSAKAWLRPATALLGSTAAIGTETSNTCVAMILPLLRIFADNATLAEAVGAAVERLREAVQKEPVAVAFGCINGKWVAAA